MVGDRGETVGVESMDSVFAALARERRRLVLVYLRDRDEVPVEELATVVAGWDAVRSGADAVEPTEREHALLALLHTDLPHMADAGVIAYDADAGVVSYEPSAFTGALLDVVEEHVGVNQEAEAEGEESTPDGEDPDTDGEDVTYGGR